MPLFDFFEQLHQMRAYLAFVGAIAVEVHDFVQGALEGRIVFALARRLADLDAALVVDDGLVGEEHEVLHFFVEVLVAHVELRHLCVELVHELQVVGVVVLD